MTNVIATTERRCARAGASLSKVGGWMKDIHEVVTTVGDALEAISKLLKRFSKEQPEKAEPAAQPE